MSSAAYKRAMKYTAGMKAKGFVRIQGWVPAADRDRAYEYMRRKRRQHYKMLEGK